MKNALILLGTDSGPESNWFPWLKKKLEQSGYEVWVPQLPGADYPEMKKYREFIFGGDFQFVPETVVVGHNSGAVAALSLLEALPSDKRIDTAVMVGVYRPERHSYSSREPILTDKVVGKAKRFVFVHSDNDPYCPLDDAKYYADKTNAELFMIPDQDHFSEEIDPRHKQLPELENILNIGRVRTY